MLLEQPCNDGHCANEPARDLCARDSVALAATGGGHAHADSVLKRSAVYASCRLTLPCVALIISEFARKGSWFIQTANAVVAAVVKS